MGNQVYFDRKEQLQAIQEMALPGEQVLAVFGMKGGGTAFLGITDKRLIVSDKSFMRKMKAIVSIPYSRIHSVAAEDESGLFRSSKLIIATSHGEHDFEFWGTDKARHAYNLILHHML